MRRCERLNGVGGVDGLKKTPTPDPLRGRIIISGCRKARLAPILEPPLCLIKGKH